MFKSPNALLQQQLRHHRTKYLQGAAICLVQERDNYKIKIHPISFALSAKVAPFLKDI